MHARWHALLHVAMHAIMHVARWRGNRYVKIFLYKFQMSKEGFRVYNKLTVVPTSSTFSVFAGISQQS